MCIRDSCEGTRIEEAGTSISRRGELDYLKRGKRCTYKETALTRQLDWLQLVTKGRNACKTLSVTLEDVKRQTTDNLRESL